MHFFTLAALVSAAAAQSIRGFNYGAIGPNGQPRTQQDFENEFNRAKNLKGTSGFTSGRLFTMIQGNTANTVSSAIPAAVATNTRLLLGLWASAGQASFDNEITALKTAISQFGTKFTDLIDGISVGSEDLYRVTPTGIANKAGVGSSPDELVKYIQQTRDAIKGTAASGKSIGHVDTWTAWVNGSNSAVTSAVDWLGMDGYPYYQTVNQNSIDNAESLFFESYNATVGASQGKPVWVTETGWPIQGPASGQATASIANAQRYWKAVACRLLGNVNTYWFTLDDTKTNPSDISFSIVGPNLGAELFDLSCAASAAPSSTPAASSSRSVGPSVASSSAQAKTPGSTAPGTTTPVTDTLPTSQVAQPPKPSTLVSSVKSAAPSYAAPSATAYGTAASSPAASSPSSPSTTPSGGKSCPANLNGQYEYPHLLVPVDSANPKKAYGTQYNATISSTISSIFNFDVPPSTSGKICSLVFLFPQQKDLQTSAFTFNGKGGLNVVELKSAATEQTTYENKPAAAGVSGTIGSISPGNGYVVFSESCKAGQRVGYEFSGIGGLELEYFQDYNPSPIGAYITVC